MRTCRGAHQRHLGLLRCTGTLAFVAGVAASYDVLPHCPTTLLPRDDVVVVQLRHREGRPAVLTGETVASKNVDP